jgi:uncharacterized protein involved in exopolysaccharide biosynthesis
MQVSGSSDPTAALDALRRRRWWIAGAIGVLLLVLYVVALAWATQRLQADVEKSIRPLQALQAGQPDA